MHLKYLKLIIRERFYLIWAAIVSCIMLTATLLLPRYMAQWDYIFNFTAFVNYYGLSLTVLSLFAGLSGCYVAKRPLHYDAYLVGRSTAVGCNLLAMFLILFSTSWIPIAISLAACLAYPTLPAIWLSGIGVLLGNSLVALLFSMSFGYFIGTRVAAKAAYLLVIIFAFVVTPLPSELFWSTPVLKDVAYLLNSTFQELSTMRYESFGFRFDAHAFWHAIFFLAAAFLLFVCAKTTGVRNRQDKRRHAALVAAAILALPFSFSMYQQSQPIRPFSKVTELNQLEKLYYPSASDNNAIVVQYYKMSLDLRGQFKNEVEIVLETSLPQITFWLDEGFSVAEMTLNGDGSTPARQGDLLTVELPSKGKQTLRMHYGGNICYVSELNGLLFMERKAGAFDMLFAWYPKLCTVNNPIPFRISVVADNNYISNFTDHTVVTARGRREFTGEYNDLYLVKGYIETVELDGTKITLPVQLARNYKSAKQQAFFRNELVWLVQEKESYVVTPEPILTQEQQEELRSLLLVDSLSDEEFARRLKAQEDIWARIAEKAQVIPTKPIDRIVYMPPFYNSAALGYLADGHALIVSEAFLGTKY